MVATAPGTGSAPRASGALPVPLVVYVALVSAAGLAALVVVLPLAPWALLADLAMWPLLVLTAAALVGETKPLSVSRADQPTETFSASTPFILALLAVAGLGYALVVQTVASLADDLINRRPPLKSAFNTGQYVLSLVAGRAVFAWAAGVPFLGGPMTVDVANLGPLLLAGVAMVAVNRTLVAGVVALVAAQPLGAIIRQDARFYAATHTVLLCIGGVAAHAAQDGVVLLVLLAAPVVAVYLTTAAALRQSHLATRDALTGIGNREHLNNQLGRALAHTHPGLVLVDLDHFKDINDTLGHPVGDQLLRQVAARLVSALDDPGAAHRLGGDEFAVVVPGGLEETQRTAHALLASLEAPMRVGEIELLVRASAGVAVAPEHGSDAETLMKNADIALYQAKLERDRIRTYSRESDVNTVERLQLLADLRTAIETGELGVEYQPQVDLTSRTVVGVEALIRWQHPTRGPVPPDDFIPLAENSGLIAELTFHVLDTALAELARWRAAGHDVRLAVNLSARHLSDLALPRQVTEALLRHEVPAPALVLEVTETGILSDPARVDAVIASLRALGVAIAVDDYGTGHASLSYLKRLEVDELKIDRSFVSDMGRVSHDYIIVRSTIALARDLGLRVIAEGIEEEETAVSLHGLGCCIGQGFHLGRPTSPAAILERLDAERQVSVAAPTGPR